MADVTVRNLREVQDYIQSLPWSSFQVVEREVSRTLLDVDRRIKTETELQRRTGSLFRSFRTTVSGTDLRNFHASIWTDSVYAPIHETGGAVTAKNAYRGVPGGPYLNIPASANKTPAGVMRLNAREVFNMGGYIAKFRSGSYGVMLGGQLMFSLKQKVDIPARLGMSEKTEDEIPTMLSRIIESIGEE